MEKKIKLARTLSILGGIAFLVMALTELFYSAESFYYLGFEVGLRLFISNYFLFMIIYTLLAIFLFINKTPYLMLVPIGFLLINAIMSLFNIPSNVERLVEDIFDSRYYDLMEKINFSYSWVISPIFSFFAGAVFFVAVIFAASKKTKAINYLWFIPIMFRTVNFIMNLFEWIYNVIREILTDDVFSLDSLVYLSRFANMIIFFAGFFILALWLKAKNAVLRGQYAAVEDVNYNGVQFQEPQPQYEAPQFVEGQYNYYPDSQPVYQQPQQEYYPDPQPAYQQPQQEYYPDPQPAYQQPQQEYYPDPQPVYQQAKVEDFEKIKKYKELLDQGIITQAEFEKKKKELLNL